MAAKKNRGKLASNTPPAPAAKQPEQESVIPEENTKPEAEESPAQDGDDSRLDSANDETQNIQEEQEVQENTSVEESVEASDDDEEASEEKEPEKEEKKSGFLDGITIALLVLVMANLGYWIWIKDRPSAPDMVPMGAGAPPAAAQAMPNPGDNPPPPPIPGNTQNASTLLDPSGSNPVPPPKKENIAAQPMPTGSSVQPPPSGQDMSEGAVERTISSNAKLDLFAIPNMVPPDEGVNEHDTLIYQYLALKQYLDAAGIDTSEVEKYDLMAQEADRKRETSKELDCNRKALEAAKTILVSYCQKQFDEASKASSAKDSEKKKAAELIEDGIEIIKKESDISKGAAKVEEAIVIVSK